MGYSNLSSEQDSHDLPSCQDTSPNIPVDEGKEPTNSSHSLSPVSVPQSRYHPYLPASQTHADPCSSLQKKLIERQSKGYLFDDLIREYHPSSSSSSSSSSTKRKPISKVNNLNISNICNIDNGDSLQKIQKKREQHNRIERRRRSLMNHSIDELWDLIPTKVKEGSKCARSSVIKVAVDYIKHLSDQNKQLREENDTFKSHQTLHLPPLNEPVNPSPTLSPQSNSLPCLLSFKQIVSNHDSSHEDVNTTYWHLPELTRIPANIDHSHYPQPIEPSFNTKLNLRPFHF